MTDNNDDLLKDLERRANEKKTDIKDEDYEVEDIESFLKEQEGDDYVPPEEDEPKPTIKQEVKQAQVTVKQPVAKEPEDLDPLKAEIVPKREEKQDPRAQRKHASTAAQPVERGRSTALTLFVLFIKFCVFIVPIILAAWIVGFWLGSWISTGWMLAVIALLSVILPGFILFIIVRKGRILWWMTGLAVGLGALLIFLFPAISAESIVRHGHWPVTAITQPMGVSPDNFATRGMVDLDKTIASKLDPKIDQQIDSGALVPLVLGGAEPLISTMEPTDTTPQPEQQNNPSN